MNGASEPTARYSAFISYSHEDGRWARWLQSALEGYRVPGRLVGKETAFGVLGRRLVPVFRDRSELPATGDLGETLTNALRSSANLIVICSPNANASRWVNEEIKFFRRVGRGDRIFCVIVGGEPNASDIPEQQNRECFPPALRTRETVEGVSLGERFEPIAADARPGGDGKSNVKLKILAGLLDVGFDVLKQREQRRRIRRLTVLTAASLVMMLVTTGLAVSARNARGAAEERQREAETLVDFMLGDLNDKLRQVQRLDILEAVDTHAMAYFLARPSRDLDDQALALRVKALQKIGDVREDQGKLPAAMEAYRAAAAGAAEQLRRTPNDADLQAAYAETLHHLGNGYWYQGDLERALESFQQAIALLERAMAAKTSDSGQAVLAYARTNEGRVREARGEFPAAKSLYEAVLVTFSGLTAKHPDEIRWQSDLADASDSLAKVAKEEGQLAQALAGYLDVYRIRHRILARSPNDRDSQENLAIAAANLAGATTWCGDAEAAARYADEAVRTVRQLVAFDGTQGDWKFYVAKYSRVLGGIARGSRRLDEAAAADHEAVRGLTELVSLDGTNSTWRRELARAEVESARLQLTTGDVSGAGHLLSSALALLQSEGSAAAANRSARLYQAEALITLGEVAARQGDPAAARAQWEQARTVIASAASVGADPDFLMVWAQARLLLGDTEGARPILEQLAQMGDQRPELKALFSTVDGRTPITAASLPCGDEPLSAGGGKQIH
jgi:tetratricopeptide (TPR) repeat protein